MSDDFKIPDLKPKSSNHGDVLRFDAAQLRIKNWLENRRPASDACPECGSVQGTVDEPLHQFFCTLQPGGPKVQAQFRIGGGW